MSDLMIQAGGWAGTALIVVAYFLNSRSTLTSQSKLYQLMNLLGAAGVGVNVFHQKAWPAVALQIIWGTIAIIALLKGGRT